MARPFGYKGKPNTCLWCGRRFREQIWLIHVYQGKAMEPVPEPGKVWTGMRRQELIVREVEPRVGRRKAKEGETPTAFALYFNPPRWQATFVDEPYFDTVSCGEAFGLRMAAHGQRLVASDRADAPEEEK